jgi:hypothetical protein
VQQEKEAHWRKEAESKRLLEQALADAERFKRVAEYCTKSNDDISNPRNATVNIWRIEK